jgi:hypothetical protein
MSELRVRVRRSDRSYGYGVALQLSATVENTSKRAVYLVMDRVYPEQPTGGSINILHGQVAASPDLFYFRFVVPTLRLLRPRGTTDFRFSVAMPLHEYGLEVSGGYYERELLTAGQLKLSIVFGYLPAPFRPKTDDPWGEFMQQQKLTGRASVTVEVAGP